LCKLQNLRKFLTFFLAFVFAAALAFPQAAPTDTVPPATPNTTPKEPWYEPFFLEGSLHYYIAPDAIADLINPMLGFRAALGYEFRRFRFAVESGYTHITGTNPLVLDLTFIPLVFKFGYALPIRWGLGLQADLNFGFLFSRTDHYDTAIDMLLNKLLEDDSERSLFGGGRLYVTYTFPGNFVKLYAGGGADIILEPQTPLPLPMLEAGLSFKPLALVGLFSGRAARTKAQKQVPSGTVYFAPDSAVPTEDSLAALDKAGHFLAAQPDTIIVLRSVAFGTKPTLLDLSPARAEYCRNYLIEHYKIPEHRIQIEPWGAQLPVASEGEYTEVFWDTYRRVDLDIESTKGRKK